MSNCLDVVSAVIESVNKERHIHIFKEREKLWNAQQHEQPLLTTITKGLIELFIYVYKSCQKGKDRFQLEWHRQCSVLLKDQVNCLCLSVNELYQIYQRWLGYCEGRGVEIHTCI